MVLKVNKSYGLRVFTLIIVFSIFLYLIFLLLLNADRGFDVTDEGYYVLVAKFIKNWYLTSFHEGHYTAILYRVFNDNLSCVRIFGVLVLLFSTFIFSINIKKFIIEKFQLKLDRITKYSLLITITTSSLFYYKWWLFTPSYNLLVLTFTNLILANYFWILNSYDSIKQKFFRIEYLFLGLLFCVLFVIKPTAPILLFIALFLFSIVEREKIDFKRAFFISAISASVFLLVHIFLIFGSIKECIDITLKSLAYIKIADTGHSLLNIVNIVKSYASLVYKNLGLSITIPVLIMLLFVLKKQGRNNKKTYFIFLIISIFIVATLYVYLTAYRQNIWFIFSIVLLNLIFISFSFVFTNKNYEESKQYLFSTIPLIILMILSSISTSYGTNNNIISHMGMSSIYIATAILILVFVFDTIQKDTMLKQVAMIFVSLTVFISVMSGYKNPYRLNTDISRQTEKLDILGGLKVDQEFKLYVDQLLQIKQNHENIKFLLDMTGASPGTIVILGLEHVGSPWMVGGYRGSNNFALEVLKNENSEKLKNAWLLTAPDGSRAIDLSLLKKVGITFPKDYEKVGTLYLKLRDETQELWKPKENKN